MFQETKNNITLFRAIEGGLVPSTLSPSNINMSGPLIPSGLTSICTLKEKAKAIDMTEGIYIHEYLLMNLIINSVYSCISFTFKLLLTLIPLILCEVCA